MEVEEKVSLWGKSRTLVRLQCNDSVVFYAYLAFTARVAIFH
jgi:hypothetical protein